MSLDLSHKQTSYVNLKKDDVNWFGQFPIYPDQFSEENCAKLLELCIIRAWLRLCSVTISIECGSEVVDPVASRPQWLILTARFEPEQTVKVSHAETWYSHRVDKV